METVKHITITYLDGSVDEFDETDNEEGYLDKFQIRQDDYLMFSYVENGTIFKMDTHRTHTVMPMSQIKSIKFTEKE